MIRLDTMQSFRFDRRDLLSDRTDKVVEEGAAEAAPRRVFKLSYTYIHANVYHNITDKHSSVYRDDSSPSWRRKLHFTELLAKLRLWFLLS